jgi:hypothetical protein
MTFRLSLVLIAALTLAPFDEIARAQFFRGGGAGLNGGFRPAGGGYGGGAFAPNPGIGFRLLDAPPADEPPDATPPPERHRPPKRRPPRPVVVKHAPPVVVETEQPIAPRRRPPPVFLYTKPVYAKPPTPPRPLTPLAVSRAAPPLAGETRYRAGEVLVEIASTTPEARIADVLRRHRLTQVEAVPVELLGLSLRRWRTADARAAIALVSELGPEAALVRVQPNYLYAPADEAPPPTLAPQQYALTKMKVAPTLENAASVPIRVAVIDTAIDESHPDLKGVVAERYDAIGDGLPVRVRDHGTAMAGGIAADGRLRGVATRVKILSARAFDRDGDGGAVGSTLTIVKALDWATRQKAQVVNMSFAGPNDPTLHDALAAASARGVVLVGAAGNAGPTAPPQYPGADAAVIAATATDADDKRFAGANVGAYIAVSAPGVDVLLPAPDGGYAMETGTSVSSAMVSGVVALMLERQPGLRPADIKRRLTETAAPLGDKSQANEFGAGLVDAARAATP